MDQATTTPSSGEGAPRRHGWRHLLLLLGTVLFAYQAARLAWLKSFAVDEFTYAHAGWAIAQGQVPFRDFFFHHLPLLEQLIGAAYLLLGDEPQSILWLRLPMLLCVLVTALGGWHIHRGYLPGRHTATGRRYSPALEALWAPLLILSTYAFVVTGVEIRHDPLAFALFLIAVAVLTLPGVGPVLAGFASGFLLATGVWASEKVLAYGAVFAVGFVLDLVRWATARRHGERAPRFMLGHPAAFLAGFLVPVALAALYVLRTDSATALWRWCVEWNILHERYYPGFSWWRYLGAMLKRSWWLLALAVVGIVATVRRRRGELTAHPDLLLILAAGTTLASFTVQRAPYAYSLIPFAGTVALLAARGVAEVEGTLMHRPDRAARWLRRGFALVIAVALAMSLLRYRARILVFDNRYQLQVLEQIGELTGPRDPVYDNAGTAVTRPHVSFFFFTDAAARNLLDRQLAREIPRAIVEEGARMFVHDFRFPTVAREIQDFVLTHFQPWSGDLRLWGQRYHAPPGTGVIEGSFLAVASERYFVHPPAALETGHLILDGRPVSERVFHLAAGPHRLRYEGGSDTLYILWLPRTGETWAPSREAPRFWQPAP